MNPAALPRSTLQDRTDRGDEPAMGVGDDQLDTGQAATAKVTEELGPELLGLTVADLAAEDFTVPVRAHAGGDHDGLGHDSAVDPGLAVGRVEEDVGELDVVEWPGAERADRLVESGADPGDLGLGDSDAAHRLDQIIDRTGLMPWT